MKWVLSECKQQHAGGWHMDGVLQNSCPSCFGGSACKSWNGGLACSLARPLGPPVLFAVTQHPFAGLALHLNLLSPAPLLCRQRAGVYRTCR